MRVLGFDVVAILDEYALSFSVVIDVVHEWRCRFRAAKIYLNPFQQIRFIESWTIDAIVRSGESYGPIERIETAAGRVHIWFERHLGRVRRPVQRGLVLTSQLAPARKRVAFEVI